MDALFFDNSWEMVAQFNVALCNTLILTARFLVSSIPVGINHK